MSLKTSIPEPLAGLAASGDTLAQEWIADHCRDQGLPDQAMGWYRQAAAGGSASAQYKLGWACFHGRGGPIDSKRALYWWRKAAAQGMSGAVGAIGILHENGHGVRRDAARAAQYYREAADAGDAAASWFLGRLYERGDGVPRDPALARLYLRRAAEQGHRSAQYSLAALPLADAGDGPPDEAVAWLRRRLTRRPRRSRARPAATRCAGC